MASSEMPETHVLAIASHVTSGYVGNTMATFCMQTLGCEVSAIHTVNYSNHVGYKRFHGRKSTPEEVEDLFTGLQQTHLDDVQVMLSGYCPSAELVQQVGKIARSIKLKATMKPGSFFWVLDPVMGDNGRLYVEEATLPAYKSLLQDADLILPNQFEAESLSDVKIHDLHSMQEAVTKLHQVYQIPHIIITSIRLPPTTSNTPSQMDEDLTTTAKISIIGSTRTSDMKPRLFRITVPAFPIFFSGTGDMFAALMVARLREAARDTDVLQQPSWRSADDVVSTELPLAKAAEKVLASMHAVLKDTADHYNEQSSIWNEERREASTHGEESHKDIDMQKHLRLTRAAEVRVVRNTRALLYAPDLEKFKAQAIDLEHDIEVEQPEPKGLEARQVGLELVQQQS